MIYVTTKTQQHVASEGGFLLENDFIADEMSFKIDDAIINGTSGAPAFIPSSGAATS
ncbi:hypothetical protein [Clostridium thailandense]|uniref:hypothetical protein n=1 Tax=Clostridium thailandense TaxID=2794346 RepID=UPI001FE2B64A|nr:hypothetical protein [Clostridium thailandense]